jgi:ADP-ribose pyrophosphatase
MVEKHSAMENPNPSDKPEAAKIGWQLKSSSCPFQSPVNRLRVDQLHVAGRGDIQYSYLERGESVIIVPVTTDGQMALIRQYRYPVDAFCYELPAGCCRDMGSATLEEVTRRELREEIGGVAGSLEYMTWFYSSSSISDEVCHIFLALDVELSREANPEPGENIQTILMPVREALALVRRGEMKTGTCALAILHCESRLRECGFC